MAQFSAPDYLKQRAIEAMPELDEEGRAIDDEPPPAALGRATPSPVMQLAQLSAPAPTRATVPTEQGYRDVEFSAAERLSMKAEREAESVKERQVADASEAKEAALDRISSIRAKRKEGNKDAWVPNPDGGIVDDVTNLAAAGASVISRGFGKIGTSIYGAQAAALLKLPPEMLEARARQINGEATPEDEALLNAPSGYRPEEVEKDPRMRLHMQIANARGIPTESNLDRIKKGEAALNNADSARRFFDISSIVNKTDTDQFGDELSVAYTGAKDYLNNGWENLKKGTPLSVTNGIGEVAAGLAKLAIGAGKAAIEHPGGLVQYLTENAPQLALAATGPVGLTAGGGLYALDLLSEGMVKYRQENGGAMPPPAEVERMAANAAGAALLDTASNVVQLGGARLFKGATKASDDLADTVKMVEKSLGKNLGDQVAKIAGRTAEGTVFEGATEAGQEYLENQVRNEETTGEGLYKAAAIGSLVGGAMSGGIQTGQSLTGAETRAAAADLTTKVQARKEQDRTVSQEALKTGDVSKLVKDPSDVQYAPDRAIAVLSKLARAADTPQEKKTELLDQATKISENHQQEIDLANAELSRSKEGLAQTENLIKRTEQQISKLPADDPRQAELAENLAAYKQSYAEDAANPLSPIQEQKFKNRVTKLTRMKEDVDTALTQFNAEVVPPAAEVDLDADLETIRSVKADATDTAPAQAAANRVISLSMSSPDSVDPTLARELADDETNALTTPQRAHLRAFEESRVKVAELKGRSGVHNDVLFGTEPSKVKAGAPKYIGVEQYRSRIATAIKKGDKKEADGLLFLLNEFTADHADKQAVFAEAITKGNGAQAQRTENKGGRGIWFVGKGASKAALRKMGGLEVQPGSNNLLATVALENDVLKTTAKELRLAIENGFKGSGNVVSSGPTQAAGAVPANAPAVAPAVAANTTGRAGQPTPAVPESPSSVPGGSRQADAPVPAAPATQAADGQDRAGSAPTVPGSIEPAVTVEKSNPETASAIQKSSESPAKTPEVVGQPQDQKSPSAAPTPAVEASTTTTERTASEIIDQAIEEAAASKAEADSATEDNQATAGNTRQEIPADQGLVVLSAEASENLFKTKFRQNPGDAKAKSQRPLVLIKDFLSNIAEKAAQFIDNSNFTDQQRTTLDKFVEYAKWSQNYILANLSLKKGEKFRHEDMMTFLIQDQAGNMVVEENVQTAMAFAAFSYIAENGRGGPWNSDSDINRILGREDEYPLTFDERRLFRKIGTRQNNVINALGQRVIDALGLETNGKVEADLRPRLIASIGAHVMKMLLDQGMLVQTKLNQDQLAGLGGDRKDSPPQSFLKIARDPNDKAGKEASADVKEIIDATRGSQGVLNKLFQVERGQVDPSLEPLKFSQKRAKNSKQGIPKQLAKIMAKKEKEPQKLRQDMWHIWSQMSPEYLMRLAGAQEVDATNLHVTNRESALASNDGLAREIDLFDEFVNFTLSKGKEGFETLFYLPMSVWKVQRVGIKSNSVNPQTSKIHRYMIGGEKAATIVDLNDAEQMDNLKLRIAEGLKVKTERDSRTASLEAYDKVMAKPAIKKAIAALVKSFDGELTDADKEAIVEGVEIGGDAFASLDALMAQAHVEHARANGRTKEPIEIMAQVDGVTNGPMLTNFLLGAATNTKALFSRLNRGGFFQIGSPYQHFNEFRGDKTAGNRDLYEITVAKIEKKALELAQQQPRMLPVLQAIEFFTGELVKDSGDVTTAGRNIVKNPLTKIHYGANIEGVAEAMAGEFIQKIYDKIQEIQGIQDPANQESQRQQLLAALKTLNVPFPAGTTIRTLLDDEFNNTQKKTIQDNFLTSLGEAIVQSISEDFSKYLGIKENMNKAVQFSFVLYKSAYDALKNQYKAELMELYNTSGGKEGLRFVETKTGRKPVHDLTSAQEAELAKRLVKLQPLMHTIYSKRDNDLSVGARAAKVVKKVNHHKTYEGQVYFGKPLPDGASSLVVHGLQETENNPGVAMLPTSILSLDSFISHETQAKYPALNVHDALGTSLGDMEGAGRELNANTFRGVMEYSPAAEMRQTLARAMSAYAELIESGVLPPGALMDVLNELKKKGKKNESWQQKLTDIILPIQEDSVKADKVKFETLAQLAFVDQYAREGSAYEVTDDDRAEALKRLAAVDAEAAPILAEMDQAMAKIIKAIESVEAGTYAVAPQPFIDGLVEEDLSAETKQAAEDVASKDDQPDTAIADSQIFTFTNVRGAHLLEAGIADPATQPENREAMTKVLAHMLGKRTTLKEAIVGALQGPKVAEIVQYLSDLYGSIPGDVWGQQGAPTIQSDAALVGFFERTPQVTIGEVIDELLGRFKREPSNQEFNAFSAKLLTAARKLLSPDLKIRYVTPATMERLVLGKPVDKSRGWYMTNVDGQEAIYVLSPDYQTSGLTVETLMHEIVHAALAKKIQSELDAKAADKAYTSEALELIENLDGLRKSADKFVKANNLSFPHATSNVQEFVAWGMTNQKFQSMVLGKITGQRVKNRFVTVMQDFIENLSKLLFGKNYTANSNNGMALLISNVSGLINAAAEGSNKATMVNLSQAAINEVMTMTAIEMHEALADGKISDDFQAKLRKLHSDIVGKLYGPMKLLANRMQVDRTVANGPMDRWEKAMNTGEAPFASSTRVNFIMGQQEQFAIEQAEVVVRATINGNDAYTTIAQKKLRDLWMEARNKLKPEDFYDGTWSNATQQDKDLAQEQWNFIFKPQVNTDGTGRSDYLSRFAAMGVANERFNKLLQFDTLTRQEKAKIQKQGGYIQTLANRVEQFFIDALDYFTGKMTSVFSGQRADEKLLNLVDKLVDIEAKKRHVIAKRQTQTSFLDPIEKGVADAGQYTREKVAQIAGSDFFRFNKNQFVRTGAALTRVIANDQVEALVQMMGTVRDMSFKGRQGLVAGLLREFPPVKQTMQELFRFTKANERARKRLIENTTKLTLNSFDPAIKLSDQEKHGISQVLMRSGAHVLLKTTNMIGVRSMLADQAARLVRQQSLQNQLRAINSTAHAAWIEQANALALYKATGDDKHPWLMMNSYVIAKMLGTSFEQGISAVQAEQAEPIINELTALYALGHVNGDLRNHTIDVLDRELSRNTGENGVEFVLKAMAMFEEKSLQDLFDGNKTLMIHGYTPEIYNPNTTIKVASGKAAELLLAEDYVEYHDVYLDAADPEATLTPKKKLYVQKDGGLAPHITGQFSFTGEASRGTAISPSGYGPIVNARTAAAANLTKTKGAQLNARIAGFSGQPRNLTAANKGHLAPTYNASGDVVGWRYLMQEQTKDLLLERDNKFENILGALAGSIYDKKSATEQNKKIIDALHQVYLDEYEDNPASFTRVGPNAPDPEYREAWRLLNYDTRQYAMSVWGPEGMLVRTDTLDLAFGYRLPSLSTMFKKNPADRGYFEEIIAGFLEFLVNKHGRILELRGKITPEQAAVYSKRIAINVIRGENFVKAVVDEMKDIIVVKSGVVLAGNIFSNLTLLFSYGVSWKDMAYHHKVAFKGIAQFREDQELLDQLRLKRDAGYDAGAQADIQSEIIRLEDALNRNPVKKLVDLGLMPTIVEDVAVDDDIYSYRSKFSRRVDEYTDKLGKPVKTALRWVYMTHDTPLYQLFNRGTQVSDFVARYTLFQHMTTRKRNPLPEDKAVSLAAEAFIDYDVPMHRLVQYFDDHGLTMFTKYFLRIQRVLFRLFREQPLRVATLGLLDEWLGLGPTVLESSILAKFGNNPFRDSIFGYPDAVKQLWTLKLLK